MANEKKKAIKANLEIDEKFYGEPGFEIEPIFPNNTPAININQKNQTPYEIDES